MRVRTTSFSVAPASTSARSTLRSACTVCAYASPPPTILPDASVAVVPATCTTFPTRTAREYPTTGSHGVPLDTFTRDGFMPETWLALNPLANRVLCGVWATTQCAQGRGRN